MHMDPQPLPYYQRGIILFTPSLVRCPSFAPSAKFQLLSGRSPSGASVSSPSLTSDPIHKICQSLHEIFSRVYHYIINEEGQPMYLGLRTSVIYYNTSIPSWVWYDRKDPESVAVSISPEASLLLGLSFQNFQHFPLCEGVHSVDFSGVRDDKCHTGVGQSRVRFCHEGSIMLFDSI